MAPTTWIIIALIAISFYQFSNPDKANDMLSPVYSPIKDFIGDNSFLFGDSKEDSNQAVVCPEIHEPVCGDGKTYDNSCEAALDGVLEVTPGGC